MTQEADLKLKIGPFRFYAGPQYGCRSIGVLMFLLPEYPKSVHIVVDLAMWYWEIQIGGRQCGIWFSLRKWWASKRIDAELDAVDKRVRAEMAELRRSLRRNTN